MEHAETPLKRIHFHAFWQLAQETAWLWLVILPPLLVNFWGLQPFELPKVLLVRTLVWLLAGLAAARFVLSGRSLLSLRQNVAQNPLGRPVLVLAALVVLTTVTAVNWQLSLWGSAERGQGALTTLTYLLLFFLAANRFRSLRQAQQMIAVMAASGAPLVLLALAQAAGWNPIGLISDARSPLFATLGRANFLGAYLALVVPLTLVQVVTSHTQKWRRLWAVLLLGELAVIGLTLARSAWLATAVSLAAFVLLWGGARLAARWRRLGWSSVGLLFLSGPLAVWGLGQGEAGSSAARLAIWQGVVKLIVERPFLGYGLDALGVTFPRVFPPQLVYYQGREFFVDRAHNFLLDWAAATGLPGLLAYLLVLGTFVVVMKKALRNKAQSHKQALLAAILAAVLGNAANNMTSFDVTATATATWLLLGVGVALSLPASKQFDAPVGKRPLWRWVVGVGLIVGLGVAIWQGNGRPLVADILARRAQQYAQAGFYENGAALAQKATTTWPHEPAYFLLLSQISWQQAAAQPVESAFWLAQAGNALQSARQLRPTDPAIWLQTAQFYAASALQMRQDTGDQAETAFRQAAHLAPNQAAIFTAWGRYHLENGEPQAAAPLLRTAVKLDASSGEAYIYLGAAELALGRLDVALADYQEAVRLLPGSSQAHAGLAETLWQLGRPAAAYQAVQDALRYDPGNTLAAALAQEIINSP